MATKSKADETSADDLDNETTKGKRLVVQHKGEKFEIANLAHDRPWREVASLIASASGERGISPMEPAMEEIVGTAQLAKTDEWTFADFMGFAQKVGERIGSSIGSPGESPASRR